MDSSDLITHRRPSISTYTGKEFFPLSPKVEDVDPIDIAHALSMKCRYTGHCSKFYSVAEHSVHMADYALDRAGVESALLALLHDGAEAYLPDVASPIKPHIVGFRALEEGVFAAIAERFRLCVLDQDLMHYVKLLDVNMFRVERPLVMQPAAWWEEYPAPQEFSDAVQLQFWPPERAELEWLRRLVQLERLR